MIDTFKKLHNGRLVLTPTDPLQLPDRSALARGLKEAGLIGPRLDDSGERFAVGSRLMDLIGFTGCAVRLNTDGADSGDFVHIHIDGPHPQPVLKQGRNSRPPRCPDCRASLADWREQRTGWTQERESTLSCPRCESAAPAWAWDWRQHAGFGRLFVCVEEVFPGEGQPLPELMRLLGGLDAGSWRHFYVQD